MKLNEFANITRLMSDAKKLASKTGESHAVIRIDGGPDDSRQTIVVAENYCDSSEFVAFDGEVVEIVEPD